MPQLPTLVLVSGAPGSGKTTLAPQLVSALGFVQLARDDIKERLWDAWARQPELQEQVPGAHWGAYYAALGALLDAGVSVVAEGSIHSVRGVPEIQTLLPRARTVIVHCDASRATVHARFKRRATPDRHPAHLDTLLIDDIKTNPGRWSHFEEPPQVGVPILRVNTEDGYRPSLAEITRFVWSSA